MATRLPSYSPLIVSGDPAALLLLRTLGMPRVQDEFADLRDRSPGRPVDLGLDELTEAEEFAAVLALESQRVRDAIAEVRAEEVVRLVSVDGVYVGR